MVKKRQKSGQGDGLISGKIILPEVDRRLHETEAPVDVICGIASGFDAMAVCEYLAGLSVKCQPEENHTDRYVFATIESITHAQKLEDSLRKKKKNACIDHIWVDKPMKTCVAESQKVINASAARTLFSAEGDDIHWAVLDTGVDITHAAIKKNCSAQRQHDFTGDGPVDEIGHGTHVAGIIAEIAPKIKIHDYKVLGQSNNTASRIIRAMYAIRKLNFEAREIMIHGVNLSLGGSVPVGSYGCGWSPECQEANSLVDSGVVVTVAAGNDGHKDLAALSDGELEIFRTFMDLGISDPGNAEKVITVGSCHRTNPHTFGPSYFSSKGPTGDGRLKPDCLAPGEKILSAAANTPGRRISKSGTSMACPHVSGAIAVFLSAKPEFQGRAAEVKKILLESCTDLERDKYFQGAGLVDLLRMIQSV